MALMIPPLEDGDFIRIRQYEPDEWPEAPLGLTFLVSVARKRRFLFWKATEDYGSSEYRILRVDTWKREVGPEGVQRAVDAVAADYHERRRARAAAQEMVRA